MNKNEKDKKSPKMKHSANDILHNQKSNLQKNKKRFSDTTTIERIIEHPPKYFDIQIKNQTKDEKAIEIKQK